MKKRFIAVDVETTGLDPWHGDRMFAFSEYEWGGEARVYREEDPGYRARLEELFSGSGEYELVFHNGKFDMRMIGKLLERPVWQDLKFHDTFIMSKLVRNNHYSHALDDLAYDYCDFPRIIDKAIATLVKKYGRYDKIPKTFMTVYQKADVERTMLLFQLFSRLVMKEDLKNFSEICYYEYRLIQVSLDMEDRGILLDRAMSRELVSYLEMEVATEQVRLEDLTWKGFNPMSHPDKVKLMEDWGIKTGKRTKSGAVRVDKHVLLGIRDSSSEKKAEVADSILKHNSFRRGISIVKGYEDLADSEGVIHPDIKTCEAVTGRQSCARPNMQNVAKEDVLLNPYPIPARRCFRPRKGFVNLHADFTGIEMRLLLHYSQERELIQVINKGEDVHSLAMMVFFTNVSWKIKKMTHDYIDKLRSAAKNGQFAICYGAGTAKLAQTLGLSIAKGIEAHTRYKERFPMVAGMCDRVIEQVRNQGYVETAFGRRIYVSQNEAYQGVNYLIQGTAAEILKRAQVKVHDLHQLKLPEVRILMSIHDELVIEYPMSDLRDLHWYTAVVGDAMTDFKQFSVPMDVSFQIVPENWSKKYDVNLEDGLATLIK